MFSTYRKRVQATGETVREATEYSTKRQMVNYILDSPSLKYVFIDMQETLPVPTIINDVRTYRERKFLFLPDMNVNVGDYITYQNMTYLATDKNFSEVFPQLQGELCNADFPIHTEERRVKIGTDAMGRPIYKTEIFTISKPCVMTDKIYSQANNSPIPLPDGAIIVKLPYSTEDSHTPKVNSTVELNGNHYKVSLISNEFVVYQVGYIEVQLQRIPTT